MLKPDRFSCSQKIRLKRDPPVVRHGVVLYWRFFYTAAIDLKSWCVLPCRAKLCGINESAQSCSGRCSCLDVLGETAVVNCKWEVIYLRGMAVAQMTSKMMQDNTAWLHKLCWPLAKWPEKGRESKFNLKNKNMKSWNKTPEKICGTYSWFGQNYNIFKCHIEGDIDTEKRKSLNIKRVNVQTII